MVLFLLEDFIANNFKLTISHYVSYICMLHMYEPECNELVKKINALLAFFQVEDPDSFISLH